MISLVLGDSMELMDIMPENREKGILIAPPVEPRDNFAFMDENTRIEMVSQSVGDGAFTVEITGGSGWKRVVIFGEALEVSVNGEKLAGYEDVSSFAEGYAVKDGKANVKVK